MELSKEHYDRLKGDIAFKEMMSRLEALNENTLQKVVDHLRKGEKTKAEEVVAEYDARKRIIGWIYTIIENP